MTDSSWIFDLESLREVHLIGAGDDAVRLMASSIPAGCRVVVTEDQANRLIELPNVIGRPDDDLDTPKSY